MDYALGPGLVVGVVAANVWAANRPVTEMLYVVAAINLLIGLANVAFCVKTIRQRSIIHG
jgi:NAD/NADP transhydrogenase beta subunit